MNLWLPWLLGLAGFGGGQLYKIQRTHRISLDTIRRLSNTHLMGLCACPCAVVGECWCWKQKYSYFNRMTTISWLSRCERDLCHRSLKLWPFKILYTTLQILGGVVAKEKTWRTKGMLPPMKNPVVLKEGCNSPIKQAHAPSHYLFDFPLALLEDRMPLAMESRLGRGLSKIDICAITSTRCFLNSGGLPCDWGCKQEGVNEGTTTLSRP